ncbi:Uncharacterised protein [Enterobacter cancerogenus]|uniref:Uncharacterized protein n=1 Tax=Enterobacter cancerogenus TaxID=69218 RepID=A0A484Z8B9_9ENTR|nr:Uncharacterised protein [Enterobacter cancerogenus]
MGRLIVSGRRVADNQDIRLQLLAIVIEQPLALGLRQQRRLIRSKRRNINQIDIVQHAVLNGQDQFAVKNASTSTGMLMALCMSPWLSGCSNASWRVG